MMTAWRTWDYITPPKQNHIWATDALIMGESRTWLPTLPAGVLSLGAIESVFTFIMSKKFTSEDKRRDEIIQMEEGSRTHSHRWDESALQGVDVVSKVSVVHLD